MLSNAPLLRSPPDELVRDFLRALVRDTAAHGRFLNTLSMLEHLGSRKIMLSQMNRDMDETVLKHLAEEARHAFFFKRQAERVAEETLQGYTADNCYTYSASRMYFGRLTAAVRRATGDAAAYPWTTRIVEIRACWFYELYEQVLREENIGLSLKSILAEEAGHLDDMRRLCGDNDALLHKLCAAESALFARFWDVLEKAETQAHVA
jgi:hypothetical protein